MIFSGVTRGYCPWIAAYQVLLPWQRFGNRLLLVVISCRCCNFCQASWLSRGVDFIYKNSLFRQNLPVTATRYEMVAKLSLWEGLASCLIKLCFGWVNSQLERQECYCTSFADEPWYGDQCIVHSLVYLLLVVIVNLGVQKCGHALAPRDQKLNVFEAEWITCGCICTVRKEE